MELIFNNQFSIFEDIFYTYLTPKQCVKLYSCNKILYNVYINNNKFESNYFTPKDRIELKRAVNEWCSNKEEAIIKYGYINNWNTIQIIDMSLIFQNKYDFNDDISDWNTSNIKDMASMFYQAYKFNKSINNWNVLNVINMNDMFYYAVNFNQSLNNWNISNLKHINFTFSKASCFNKDNCNNWDLNHIKDINKMYMLDSEDDDEDDKEYEEYEEYEVM